MSRTISIKSLFKEYWKLWLGFGLYGFGIGIGSKHTIISIIFVIVGIILIIINGVEKEKKRW